MKITVVSTTQAFDMNGVLVRSWHGHDETGGEVIALICAIRTERDITDLTPVPPPALEWSERVRAAMGELWHISYALTEDDAEMLLKVAQQLIAEGKAGAISGEMQKG